MTPIFPAQLPLFVYGTLRPGTREFDRYLAAVARSVRPATVRGALRVHPEEDYPFLTDGEGLVYGEIVAVDAGAWPGTIATLDAYEDYDPAGEADSLYLRRRIVAIAHGETAVTCWTYLWNRPEIAGKPLLAGDWSRRPSVLDGDAVEKGVQCVKKER